MPRWSVDLIRKKQHPGPPMTLGNMRELGMMANSALASE
jgi:hypothetical protein